MFFADFKDASDFGKMAETLYEESYCNVFKKMGCKYHYDVRLLRPFQLVDIDFIESKIELDLSDEIKQLDLVCNTGIHTDANLKNNKYYFVEVKADSRTHDTGNAVLEITAKDKSGWFGNTRADFIAYVPYDEEKKYFLDYCWMINSFKLRQYLGLNDKNINKQKGLRMNYWTVKGVKDSNCLNILCGVDRMVECGAAKVIDYYKNKEKGE